MRWRSGRKCAGRPAVLYEGEFGGEEGSLDLKIAQQLKAEAAGL